MATPIFYWRPFTAGTATASAGTADPCDLPLACLQTAISNTLTGTAVIQAPTRTRDSFGGYTEAYSATGTAFCRVSATGKLREYVFADGVRSVPEFRITLPYGTAVYGRYRVVENGYTYEVLGTNAGETMQTAQRALCVRIDG